MDNEDDVSWENPIPSNKNKKEAIEFFKSALEAKENAIYTFNTGNKNEIYIDKTQKEYVKGEQLFVLYKGISIYANLTQCILINTQTDVVMIKPYKEITPPEDKEYIILLYYGEDGEDNTFQAVKGRQEAFDYIKSMVEYTDLDQSLILAETTTFVDAISIYDFMKSCIIHKSVKNDDGFDIDDYRIYFDSED